MGKKGIKLSHHHLVFPQIHIEVSLLHTTAIFVRDNVLRILVVRIIPSGSDNPSTTLIPRHQHLESSGCNCSYL